MSSTIHPGRSRWFGASSLLLLVVLYTTSVAGQESLYQSGRAHWQARRFLQAQKDLLAFREQPYGRTADVDYMLGTAACRLPTQADHDWGVAWLSLALQRYQLTSEGVTSIRNQIAECRKPIAVTLAAPPALVLLARSNSAGTHVRSKMFTTDPSRPLQAYTARSLGTLDPVLVKARITPLGSPALMAEKLAATAAPLRARVQIEGRFAFVIKSAQDAAQIHGMASQLEAYLAFLERNYATLTPPNYLTIYLVSSVGDLRNIARKVHGMDVSPATIGYTFQDDFSAVAVVQATKTGTLRHELFHMLVRSSFGDIPQWLDEGVAALYEQADLQGDSWRGQDNWRGPILASRWPERPTLAALMDMPWDVSDQPGRGFDSHGDEGSKNIPLHFAAARYYALWLQDQGKLFSVYAGLRAIVPTKDSDPSAAARAVVEANVGSLAAAQTAFDDWFRAQHTVGNVNRPARPPLQSQRQPKERR